MILGQPGFDANPPKSFGSWESYQAFWFARLGYKIHAEEVAAFHRSKARIRIAIAPARTSKSYSAAHEVIPYAMPTEPLCDSLIWIVAPNYPRNKEFDYLHRIFTQQRDIFPGIRIEKEINSPKGGDMMIRFEKGRDAKGRICRTIIQGLSAENENSLQSEEVSLAVLSEAKDQSESVWTQCLEPRTRWAILPTTPHQKAEWIRDLCNKGENDPALSIDSFTFPPHANPLYNYERYELARKAAVLRARAMHGRDATAEQDPLFAEQFLGRWSYYTGRVLPFERARHVIANDAFDLSRANIFVSVDYGFEDHASAGLWSIDSRGIVVRFDEVYERHLTTQGFIDRITEKLDEHQVKPKYVCGDPSRPEVDRVMREAGLEVFVMDKNAQRDRAAGHRRLVDLLAAGPCEGFPGLFVTERCVNTIAEWEKLHYREGAANEYGANALMGRQHAFDDARYFVMTRPDPVPEPKPEDDLARWIRDRQQARRRSLREGLQARGIYRHTL